MSTTGRLSALFKLVGVLSKTFTLRRLISSESDAVGRSSSLTGGAFRLLSFASCSDGLFVGLPC